MKAFIFIKCKDRFSINSQYFSVGMDTIFDKLKILYLICTCSRRVD